MAEILCTLLIAYAIIILVRIIISWFPIDPNGIGATVAGFLYLITDPLLSPLRRIIPPVRLGTVGLDLTPTIVIFGLFILSNIICG
jgi:YggT family protein